MSLYYRANTLLPADENASTRPKFGAGYTVIAYAPGGVVEDAVSGSGGSTVVTMPDHGFAFGDKAMLYNDAGTVCSVTAVSGSSVTFGANLSLAVGDYMVNLGNDTGHTSPNYDGSPVDIFSGPGATVQLDNSTVVSDDIGSYSYWTATQTVWELLLDPSSAPVSVVIAHPITTTGTVDLPATRSVTLTAGAEITTAGVALVRLTNTSGANTITLDTPDVENRKVRLIVEEITAGSITLADNGFMSGSWVPAEYDSIEFQNIDGSWVEVSRRVEATRVRSVALTAGAEVDTTDVDLVLITNTSGTNTITLDAPGTAGVCVRLMIVAITAGSVTLSDNGFMAGAWTTPGQWDSIEFQSVAGGWVEVNRHDN